MSCDYSGEMGDPELLKKESTGEKHSSVMKHPERHAAIYKQLKS